MRRLITRLLAVIPSMVVAIALGRKGIDALLVASQVVLSIVLPFVTFPLLWCTSSKAIMSVRKKRTASPISSPSLHALESNPPPRSPSIAKVDVDSPALSLPSPSLGKPPLPESPSTSKLPDSPGGVEAAEEDEIVDYSNNKVAIAIGAVIWLVVVAANVYVLVDLGMQAAR